jgi:hypothetical protein
MFTQSTGLLNSGFFPLYNLAYLLASINIKFNGNGLQSWPHLIPSVLFPVAIDRSIAPDVILSASFIVLAS